MDRFIFGRNADRLSSAIVAMFEFAIEEQRIVKVNERHYKIVEATEISGDDLRAYSLHI